MQNFKPIFYPFGPQELGNDTMYGILLCGEAGGTEVIWGESWDAAIAMAEHVSGITDWVTLPWLAKETSKAAGRGHMIDTDAVAPLGWALANHADPAGVTRAVHEATAYPMMKAMGMFAVMRLFMSDGQSSPFQLDVATDGSEARYFGAYDLSGGNITVMLTPSKDELHSIYATHRGVPLPDDVKFLMAQILEDGGPIGRANGGLFGSAFKPRLLSRLRGSVAPIDDDEARLLTLVMRRLPALVEPSTPKSGEIALLGTKHHVAIEPIDLDL